MGAFYGHRFLSLAMAIGAGICLGGCSYTSGGRDYYDMYRAPAAAEAQVLNPEAGKNRKVVAGLDGPAAERVNASYTKSFEHDPIKRADEAFGVGE